MQKQTNKFNISLIIFLTIEFILWFWIEWGIGLAIEDGFAATRTTVYAEFSFIVLNVIAAFVFSKKISLLHIGLSATLLGDLFLTLLNPITDGHYSFLLDAGLTAFFVAHIFYFIFLLKQQSKYAKKVHIIIRVTLTIAIPLIALIIFKDRINYLVIVASIYVPNFVLNIIYSFMNFKKNILFSIGLVLFFLCDAIVGLEAGKQMGIFSITNYSLLDHLITWRCLDENGLNVAWFYYCSSQVLITLFTISQSRKLFEKSN